MNMGRNKKTIGLFLSSAYETLFIKDKKAKLLLLGAENTAEEKWLKKNYRKRDYVLYKLNPGKEREFISLNNVDLLKFSDLKEVLKNRGVNFLFGWLHTRDPKELMWLKRYFLKSGITPLATDFDIQKNFENKIWFDGFLTKHSLPKPESRIISGKGEIPSLTGRIVVQEPYTAGGEETYIFNKSSDITKKKNKNIFKPGKKYLVRKFIKGGSYGITIFINAERIVLSAIRRQCLDSKKMGRHIVFNGVQWLPTRFFKPKLIAEMNKIFLSLGQKLYESGFKGFAGIDFIIDEGTEKIKIIECNPRLSSSTLHTFIFNELISGFRLNRLLTRAFTEKKNSLGKIKFCKIPMVNFNGSTLDINGFHETKEKTLIIKKEYEPGIYRIKKGKIFFYSSDFRKIDRQMKSFILASFTQPGDVAAWNSVLSSVISNFPLYDKKTGKINSWGRKILGHFKYI